VSTSILLQSLVQECPAVLFANIPGKKAETFATSTDHRSMSKAKALRVGTESSTPFADSSSGPSATRPMNPHLVDNDHSLQKPNKCTPHPSLGV